MDNKLVAVGGIGVVLLIAVLALVLSHTGPAVTDNQITGTIGVQTISANPATVDFGPGTTGTGNIVGGISYAVAANASFKIVNASVSIMNSTTVLFNANISSQNFGIVYTAPLVQTWGTLYMNFTAQNNSATFKSSTNTFTVNPTIGSAKPVDYGSYVTVSGGLLNDTMYTIQLYYPSLYMKGFDSSNASNVAVVLSKRA